MNNKHRQFGMAAAGLALALVALACSDFEKWPCPTPWLADEVTGPTDTAEPPDHGPPPTDLSLDIGVDGTITPRTCNACLVGLAGRAFRFDSIVVTEPAVPPGLPNFLNNIWREDVCRYILNIVLRIDSVDLVTGELIMTAGSAWHDYEVGQEIPEQPGCLAGTHVVDPPPPSYYLLPGYTSTFHAQLDESCNFETTQNTSLRFHSGKLADPFICSPEHGDEIPITKLQAAGRLTDDCSAIVSASLRGCIDGTAACRICSWGPAPNYDNKYIRTNANYATGDCTLDYCRHFCGTDDPAATQANALTKWANFGAFVDMLGTPKDCDLDGQPAAAGQTEEGYSLAGTWTAAPITLTDPPTK